MHNSATDKLITLFENHPKTVFYGVCVLAEMLGTKPQTITQQFSHKRLARYRALRPKMTPNYWDMGRAYRSSDKKRYQRKQKLKQMITKFGSYHEQMIFSPTLSSNVIVFSEYPDEIIAPLQNGLEHAHLDNCQRLLGKYQKVTTSSADGIYVASTREGLTIASDRYRNIADYPEYKNLKSQIGDKTDEQI